MLVTMFYYDWNCLNFDLILNQVGEREIYRPSIKLLSANPFRPALNTRLYV